MAFTRMAGEQMLLKNASRERDALPSRKEGLSVQLSRNALWHRADGVPAVRQCVFWILGFTVSLLDEQI
jgi:hypothetical protein